MCSGENEEDNGFHFITVNYDCEFDRVVVKRRVFLQSVLTVLICNQ